MPFDVGPMNMSIVWNAPGAVYGYCPKCGSPGEMRERLDGTGRDRCMYRKHTYPSTEAKMVGIDQPVEKQSPKQVTARRRATLKAARRK